MIHLTWDTYIIILPFVFLGGLIDSIAGGGGLITVPAYLAAGLPPHFALANNKFSSCSGTIFATGRYFRHGMIDVPVAVTSAVLALLGSYLGTRTVLLIDPHFLHYLLLILIPSITVFTLINKNLGLHDTSSTLTTSRKIVLGALAGFVIGFYDGFFGPGTGTFLILFFAALLKYDFVVANGNTKVVNLASNIAAVVTFLLAHKIVFALAIPAGVCGIAGNLAGSRMVVKKGSGIIRPIFIIALILLMGKIIYDLIVQTG
ncbi:MAG TPA: TSUP family transporter [Candidatus Cloacimonadota bacterium]|nr:TSUP family transporter [Candidatus Cloacimonadota bacterium]HPT71963.1 TSUP family transporter [Candidatus Cloacimonadota bacterium]